jgi:hypothetical protein
MLSAFWRVVAGLLAEKGADRVNRVESNVSAPGLLYHIRTRHGSDQQPNGHNRPPPVKSPIPIEVSSWTKDIPTGRSRLREDN